jgi:hypothetical protein
MRKFLLIKRIENASRTLGNFFIIIGFFSIYVQYIKYTNNLEFHLLTAKKEIKENTNLINNEEYESFESLTREEAKRNLINIIKI